MAKKKRAKKSSSSAVTPISRKKKEVTIEKASNGYIVSSLNENYQRQNSIAKTKKEAQNLAIKMLK